MVVKLSILAEVLFQVRRSVHIICSEGRRTTLHQQSRDIKFLYNLRDLLSIYNICSYIYKIQCNIYAFNQWTRSNGFRNSVQESAINGSDQMDLGSLCKNQTYCPTVWVLFCPFLHHTRDYYIILKWIWPMKCTTNPRFTERRDLFNLYFLF